MAATVREATRRRAGCRSGKNGGHLNNSEGVFVYPVVRPGLHTTTMSLVCLVVCNGISQERQAAPKKPGSITGIVISDFAQKPLKRAMVILRPRTTGANALADTTGEDGRFSFAHIPPGSYSILVLCDGYVPSSTGRIGAYRMPPLLQIQSDEKLNDYTFRLRAWGVLSGKITFEDGLPAVNTGVQLYREYRLRGRHGFTRAGEAATNDLGVYRIHGLLSGSYYIAALYQKPLPADAEEERHVNASGQEVREQGYAVTFYPSAQKLGEAVPVVVNPGAEVAGTDIVLRPVTTVRIRGRVIGGLSGRSISQPSIALERTGADNSASIPVPIRVTYPRQGEFEVSGVTPGPYLLLAAGSDDDKVLTARQIVSVGDSDVTGLSIVVAPPKQWRGRVSFSGEDDPSQPGLRVIFEARRQSAQNAEAQADKDGWFALSPTAGERYDIDIAGASEDAYIKSASVASYDVLREGFEAAPGDSPVPISIVVSTHGGRVIGVATADNNVAATGATVSLIPEPPRGRTQQYKTGYVDPYGMFRIRGVAPGNYIALAWYDAPPCDLYDPLELYKCRAYGVALTVAESADTLIQLRVEGQ
jgi:hypothetical protein